MSNYYFSRFPLTEKFLFRPNESIMVVIIGFGEGAALMLDGAIQNSQLPCFWRPGNTALPFRAKIFCRREEAERYLRARQELMRFCKVNLSYNNYDWSSCPRYRRLLGEISFCEMAPNYHRETFWKGVLPKHPHYVFVSLNNSMNYEVAQRIADLRRNASIHTAWRPELSRLEDDRIGVYNPNSRAAPGSIIDRTTRLVHRVWEACNKKYDNNRRPYDLFDPINRYYRDASESLACSLPDYVRAVDPNLNVDYFHGDNDEVASKLSRRFQKNPEVLKQLLGSLHYRCIAQKMCNGWCAPDSYYNNNNHNDFECIPCKMHAGIASAKPESPLFDQNAKKYFISGKASASELNSLDPLDYGYVESVRAMVKAKAYGCNMMDRPTFKENDALIAKNISFILTGDESMLDETMLWNGF